MNLAPRARETYMNAILKPIMKHGTQVDHLTRKSQLA
jgi:hypothetical protein